MELAEVRQRTAELNLKLLESSVDFYTYLGLIDPRDLQNDIFGEFGSPNAPPYRVQSRKRGEVLPVYLYEQGLRNIRDRARVLAAENEFAVCALTNTQNYVIDKGFSYRATAARREGISPKLVAQVQQVIDAFTDYHELAQIERECVWRCHRDGEAFIRFFWRGDGLVLLRFVEPEHVRAPAGETYGKQYSFGVQTVPGDVATVVGYWIVEDPITRPFPVFVPANEILHIKINVDSSAKRGLPTFYAVEGNLRRVDDLLASLSSLAKSRAKIAMIRRFNGTVKDTISNFVNNLTEITAVDPASNTSLNIERLRYGTILNATANIDYEFPGAEVGANDYVQVIQACLRAIAARFAQPEYMLSADASNANFASTMVAEAPAIKGFAAQQRFFARRFGECRYPEKESVIWKQLRHCVEKGILPESIYRDIDVQVEAPNLVVRDPQAQAMVDKTYNDMNVKSVQTIRQEQGLDSDQEIANLKAEPPAEQQPAKPGGEGAGDPLAAMRKQAVGEAFDASAHPRGNQDNPGEFAKKGEGGGVDQTTLADHLYDLYDRAATPHVTGHQVDRAVAKLHELPNADLDALFAKFDFAQQPKDRKSKETLIRQKIVSRKGSADRSRTEWDADYNPAQMIARLKDGDTTPDAVRKELVMRFGNGVGAADGKQIKATLAKYGIEAKSRKEAAAKLGDELIRLAGAKVHESKDDSGHEHKGTGPGGGQFAKKGEGGAKKKDKAGKGGVKIKPTKERAFNGQQVPLKHPLSKQEAGALGENILIAWLKSQGMEDAQPLNAHVNNFPIDLIQDHECIEAKTGQVGNSPGAQQWRLTIGEPGKAEKEWLKTASPEDKKRHNAEKMQAIHDRKERARKEQEERLGRPVKAVTMTTLINPDTKTADLFRFEGYHDRIGWNSEEMKKAYIGSVKYA